MRSFLCHVHSSSGLLETYVLFSRRHTHPSGCRSPNCVRLMALPVRNPIRISPVHCSDCITKVRESDGYSRPLLRGGDLEHVHDGN
ncbi:hypothetical protein BDQ17DRAFT_359963 [Cyathus striatus]|nr:hypothetical protein BDQ17DRAFT_359963 [Cyathus striatus]